MNGAGLQAVVRGGPAPSYRGSGDAPDRRVVMAIVRACAVGAVRGLRSVPGGVGTLEDDVSLAWRIVALAGRRPPSDSADTLGVVERRELIGSLEATAAMVAVGSSVAAATALVAYPIAGGQALRYGFAGALLVAVARGRLPRLTRGQAARLLALAASGLAGFNAFLIAAVREADAGSVGVIVGCAPVALALAGPLLEGAPFGQALSQRPSS
jgi:hypothetical protein